MEYIKLFQNHSEYENFVSGGTMVKPNVSHCINENEVHYNSKTWADEYLTFEALEDGTFTFTLNKEVSTDEVQDISYSLDNGETWITTSNANNEIVTITTPTVNGGDTVLWKGTATRLGKSSSISENVPLGATIISSTNNFEVKGNIMSLLYGDEYKNKTDLTNKDYCFWYLFRNCINLQSISKLSLPATTLASHCYYYMFDNCTSLVNVTELPATTLADYCYRDMFRGCTSLTTVPELPATTLASNCYGGMFYGCTSLTVAPELPATTMAEACYSAMFANCSSLTNVPYLPAVTLAESCYSAMFRYCTSIETVPLDYLPVTVITPFCYNCMFQGCTNLKTAPNLPATTLPSGTTYTGCYTQMFYGCTSLTTAPELPAATLTKNCYSYMFNGCTNLKYIKAMFTTTPSTSYTENWVTGVAANGTFVKNSAAQWDVTGVNGIPTGWTVETATE